MNINIKDLSLKELKQLRKDVETAIENFDANLRAEALVELEAKAKAMGFTLAELTGGKPRRTKVAPKYRNPQNPDETWTGRGRRPKWFEAALANGANIDDFLI
ncbi:H-NS histone family protein [Pseudogemmobacter sp. W21_MBD1_M6]|uniref:H-NS histone family protein n=1 Tax=Pseudogemmobacter sp. W21_MBD1_M6 TaxID=3240271 RepID=UPI003F977FCF